tara:strand:+ start:239 stop:1117 length:879 start_codon:yes stop_codon:yes gene_type:complete
MAWGMDDCIVGGQLRVGTGLVPAIKEGDQKINGSMHAEGPIVFGAPNGEGGGFGDNVGTLMIARTTNSDEDCTPADRSLWVKGNTRLEGDSGTPWAVNLSGNQEIQGNGQTDNALYVTGGGTVNSCYIEGDLYVSGAIDGGNKGRLAARFAAADASPKPFDMQHPTKGEGNRLRYACIEGPEVGVYFRGRLRRGKEIFLPNYWKGLVHIQSITVQLQPIGAHQDIIIKRWDDEKIYLQSNGGLPIDCFYHVYAERKDCNPLVVEYQGDGWEDYPDKDYKDPNFSGPPNIITV